jgi:hypothetical protein
MNELIESKKILDVISSVSGSDGFDISTTESKFELAEELIKTPQVACSVVHRFSPGIYIREAMYLKNTLVIGMDHVGEHMNVLLRGSINVIDGLGNPVRLDAPCMFTAPAGSKIGFTLDDVIWQNIYATTETDVEVLESTLFRSPPMWKEHLAEKLSREYALHEDDRNDFASMLEETGWKAEEVRSASEYTNDRIDFPYGGYAIAKGDSPIQGKGMFCTAPFTAGNTIAPMRLNGRRTPAGYLINHSKNPNCIAQMTVNGDMYVVAILDIQGMMGGDLGDEITLDYRQVMKINGLLKGK